MKKPLKMRADQLLFEKKLASSREKSQAMILSGIVFSNGMRIEKAGQRLMSESVLELKGEPLKYVSRGGLKLEGALRNFEVDATGLEAVSYTHLTLPTNREV